jgi:putative oxidoreductase
MLQNWTGNAIAIVRIIVGAFMVYHGAEIFNPEIMQRYYQMLADMKMSNAVFLSKLGKSCELVAGILLTTGTLTRIGALVMAGTMSFITFSLGEGRVYMEEQHPFMFVLFAFIFFFDGGKKWSLDSMLFRRKRQ